MTEKHALIIDDDEDYRGALTRALAEEGFYVHEVESVREGLEALEANPRLRVVILDLELPADSGSVLLDRLKNSPEPYWIIVHTAHSELLNAEEAINLNVCAYVQKGGGGGAPKQGKAASLSEPLEGLKFAINHAFRDMEMEKSRQNMRAHLAIQREINDSRAGLNVLNQIARHLLAQTDAYTCHIRLLDTKKGDYELVAYAGPKGVEEIFSQNRRLSDHFSGEVAKSGKKRIYQNIQTDREFKKFKEKLLATPLSGEARKYLETIGAARIVPIKTGLSDKKDQVDAVLNVSGTEVNFFTPARLNIIDEFVAPANLAISKAWLEDKRAEIHDDYKHSNELLVKVSEKLQQANLNQIYDLVLRHIAKIINPEMVSLFQFSERTGLIEKRAEFVGGEVHHDREETYAPGECLTGHVFESGEPLLINENPTKHPLYDSGRREMDSLVVPSRRIEHYLAAPLIAGDEVIGVIRSVNKKSSYYNELYPQVVDDETCLLSRGFSRDCKLILAIIASHLAATIKNSDLIEQLNDKITQLGALANVGQRISANYGLETKNLLEMIVKETATVMNAAICMLFLRDPDDNRKLDLKQCHGIDSIAGASYDLEEGYYTAQVFKTGEPKILPEKAADYQGKFDPEILRQLKEKYGPETKITSLMIVPIFIKGDSPVQKDRINGVLKVINRKDDRLHFDQNDLSLFETFASQISVALVMSESHKSFFKLVEGVAHENRNAIVHIPGNADVIMNRMDKLIEQAAAGQVSSGEGYVKTLRSLKEVAVTIRSIAEEARDFTEDLLGFSDNKFINRQPMDLNGLIEKEALRLRANPPPGINNAGSVELVFDPAEGGVVCDIYEIPFVHVVRNIVTNAYQWMGDVGRLTIRTRRKANRKVEGGGIAAIDFIDTGEGIEEKDLNKLFRSDFSRRPGGNGLGLWLVRLTLLRMDGAISVRSEVGRGSVFTIELPLSGRRAGEGAADE